MYTITNHQHYLFTYSLLRCLHSNSSHQYLTNNNYSHYWFVNLERLSPPPLHSSILFAFLSLSLSCLKSYHFLELKCAESASLWFTPWESLYKYLYTIMSISLEPMPCSQYHHSSMSIIRLTTSWYSEKRLYSLYSESVNNLITCVMHHKNKNYYGGALLMHPWCQNTSQVMNNLT